MVEKKLQYIFVLFVISCISAGCGSSNPAAPASAANIRINLFAQRIDNSVMPQEQFALIVSDNDGNTLSKASVYLAGPSGMIVSSPGGYFNFSHSPIGAYQFNAVYALSVTYNAVNYYTSFTTGGDMTIAADGSTISWGYDTDSSVINIISPLSNEFSYGPLLNRPFDVTAANVYNDGPGTYNITVTLTDIIPLNYLRTEVSGAVTLQHVKTVQIIKP